ncbi:MAG: hypothetical protein K2X87_32035 [Gemmataceae bacterium]|nr:hypothetical protein [Gemmataceae bacterium]
MLPDDLTQYADHARWLVHTIYQRRVFDRRHRDDFIPLKAAYLRRVLPWHRYTDILAALAAAGVLEIDRHYIKHEESRKYRLAAGLRAETHRRHPVTHAGLARKLVKLREAKAAEVTLDVHRHLWSNLHRVEIDFTNVRRDLCDRPELVHQAEVLHDRQYHFHADEYGRVHTNLTNLSRALRPYLSVGGSPLVNLDIRNSQPLLLSVLVVNWCVNGGGLSPLHSFHLDRERDALYLDIPEDFFSKKQSLNCSDTNPSPSHTLYDVKLHAVLHGLGLPEDLLRYIGLTQEGRFYEYLMRQAAVPPARRDDFKREFFGKVLFCKNHERYVEGRAFEGLFPSVAGVIREIKREDYTQASKLLQRVESSLVINRVVRRLMEALPDAFVATIHDSVLTTRDVAGEVEAAVRREFGRVGLTPTLRWEEYRSPCRRVAV